MNRKQEAIDLLDEWRDNILRPDALSPEEFYDRIVALIRREFPDKALKDLLLDSDLWTKEALFWKIKCLVEGQLEGESFGSLSGLDPTRQDEKNRDRSRVLTNLQAMRPRPTEGDNILEQAEEEVDDIILEQDKPKGSKLEGLHVDVIGNWAKGTCPKCGGSKKVPVDPPTMTNIPPIHYEKDCPACKGTGECQHKGKKAYAAADNENSLPRCLDCKQEIEQRIGQERRFKSWHGIGKPNSVEMQLMRANPAIPLDMLGKLANLIASDRRTLPDRRK